MEKLIGSRKQLENTKLKVEDEPPEIDESLGELVCDECGGRGCTINEYTLSARCWKCQGDGKVDWVSHCTGKPKKPMFDFGSSSFSSSVPESVSNGVYDDAIDAMSKQLADSIDKEIIDDITNDSNKYIKMYGQEVKQVDNGIVFKQLFHTDT